MGLTQQNIRDTKTVLSILSRRIPETVYGVEKQMFIGNDVIGKMSQDQKLVLRRLVNGFLEEMRRIDASDIDVGGWGSNSRVWLRVHGEKKPVEAFGHYEINETDVLIQSILMERQRGSLYEQRNLDFSYTFSNGDRKFFRYRANSYFDLDSLSLNMRAINTDIRSYEGYGFHTHVTQNMSLAHTKEGLILVTGITGSGKSTTLDAIVDLNNRSVNAHIIIIASPIEFVHNSKKCIIRHREVGRDTRSFKHGTIEALRQDPDIIIIGEMRDPDTIMAALEVADSGHKVFSTLHTSSAVESIDRVIGEVPSIEQERVRNRLADILRCVVSQKLVPSTDGRRVLAKEVMVMVPSIRAAIKNNNTGEIYQMISEGKKSGMHTIEQDLARLFNEKKITLNNALNFANNKRRMKQLLKVV
jgi:twitching motility protein PilT